MKKTILLVSSLFFLFIFSGSTSLVNPPDPPDKFLITAFNSGWDWHFSFTPDTLGFNVWHRYTSSDTDAFGRHYPLGWTNNDGLFAHKDTYLSDVTGILNGVNTNNMTALMMRPKIEWLVYGQRSDYQCETVSPTDDFWFYAFNDNHPTADAIQDSGATVVYCEEGTDSEGFVAKNLRANTEQSKAWGNFYGDSECNWFIKPRIRIDSSFANNPANLTVPVCKVIIKDADGNTLKEAEIKVRNFKNGLGATYNGNYIEEYFFTPYLPQDTSTLELSGAWGNGTFYEARGINAAGRTNHADIQVYWYGDCDMWIDYVRVDSDVADGLLNPNSANYNTFNEWIEWEAQDVASHSSAYRFYFELFEFNNIPCMKYVNNKLDSLTDGKATLMTIFTPIIFAQHVPFDEREMLLEPEYIKEHLYDEVRMEEILTAYYPFTNKYRYPEPSGYDFDSNWSYISNTLPENSGAGILAKAVSPASYDNWLQTYLDSVPHPLEPGGIKEYVRHPSAQPDPGGFRYYMQMGDALSKLTGKPFMYNAQAHMWFLKGETQREPTIEELDLQVNVSLTYGARGLIWFQYASGDNEPGIDTFYDRGIANGDPDTLFQMDPRYLNQYGQRKWQKIGDISRRLKKWEPYIMSFNDNDRKSYIYRFSSERSAMTASTFINELRTYPPYEYAPDPIDPELDNLPPDTLDNAYLQASFFKIDGETEINKYFMIVNNRCAPYVDSANLTNLGGRRLVAMKVNANQLPGFNNWKVINLKDSSTVWTFDKNSNSPVYLGDFMPGEGKLFKVAPVMQEGGTFVTNEYLNSNVVCKDTVYSDGFNLDIPIPRTVEFKSSGKVIMEGGSFFCGYHPGNGEDDIILKGNGSDKWTGIVLDGCDTVKVDNTIVQNVEDYDPPTTYYAFDIVNCYKVTISDNNFTGYNTGGVRCNYTSASGVNILVTDNTFNMNNNYSPVVYISANSSMSLPVIIDDNTFTVSSSSNSQAIVLNNISGAAIKNNDITNYQQSILALSSSADLYNNSINSSISGQSLSIGSSNLNLTSGSKTVTGGLNTINNSSVTAHNMDVAGGLFYIAGGNNTFLIPSSYTSGKHMNGYFSGESDGAYPAEGNCFKYGTTVGAVHNVTWGSGGSSVTFGFNYNCGQGQGSGMSSKSEGQENFILVPITDEYNDTLFLLDSGESSLHDSMFVEMRKRNYAKVIEITETILSNEPESKYAPDAIHKLYLASLSLDSAGSRMSPLKNFTGRGDTG